MVSRDKDTLRTVSTWPVTENKRSTGQEVTEIGKNFFLLLFRSLTSVPVTEVGVSVTVTEARTECLHRGIRDFLSVMKEVYSYVTVVGFIVSSQFLYVVYERPSKVSVDHKNTVTMDPWLVEGDSLDETWRFAEHKLYPNGLDSKDTGYEVARRPHFHVILTIVSLYGEGKLLTSSLSFGVPVPRGTCKSLRFSFSLSSHPYLYIGLLFTSRFIT